MHSKIHSQQTRGSLNVWLYSTVFLSKASLMAVLFLFISFLIQPFHQALAMEPDILNNETESIVSADVVFDDQEEVEEVELEEEADDTDVVPIELDEESASQDSVELLEPDAEEDLDAEDSSSISVENSSGEQEAVSPTASSSQSLSEVTAVGSQDEAAATSQEAEITAASSTVEATVDIDTATTSTSSSQENTSTTTNQVFQEETGEEVEEEIDNDASSSGGSTDSETNETQDEQISDVVENETSDNNEIPVEDEEIDIETTDQAESQDTVGDELIQEGVTDIVNEMVTLTRQLVTEENYYQFSRQSCAPVGDGTFHCSIGGEQTTDTDSAVYAEQVEGGDMEIFIRTSKNGIKQITDNLLEDTAPDYDAETQSVVWQRLIDGRYQVISYDLETEEETQLTFSRTNNMDPKVSVEGIVWQAWDGNDWEIAFFDGRFTDVITDNNVQDVTPVIEDGYILWSILGGSEQEARVYTIASGETLTIRGHEGGAIANPRFVLVYDTKFDNGDIITKGFDPVTGLSSPIAAKPAEAPIDIPETDPVGEIRALIQNKSSQEEKEVVTDSVSDGNALDVTASSTSVDNLNLASSTLEQNDQTDVGLPAENENVGDFELTEFDLVITSTATSTSFDDIERELPPLTDKSASSTQE